MFHYCDLTRKIPEIDKDKRTLESERSETVVDFVSYRRRRRCHFYWVLQFAFKYFEHKAFTIDLIEYIDKKKSQISSVQTTELLWFIHTHSHHYNNFICILFEQKRT